MKAIKDMKIKRSWWLAIVTVVAIVSVSILSVAYNTTKMNEMTDDVKDTYNRLADAYDRLLAEKNNLNDSSDETSDDGSGSPASEIKDTEPADEPVVDPYADITCRSIFPEATENLTLYNVSKQMYTVIYATDGFRGNYEDKNGEEVGLFIYKYNSDANLTKGAVLMKNAIEVAYSNDILTATLAFSKGPFLFIVSSFRNMFDETRYAPSQEAYELAEATGYYEDATIITEQSANLK